jgi:hypothetical protein
MFQNHPEVYHPGVPRSAGVNQLPGSSPIPPSQITPPSSVPTSSGESSDESSLGAGVNQPRFRSNVPVASFDQDMEFSNHVEGSSPASTTVAEEGNVSSGYFTGLGSAISEETQKVIDGAIDTFNYCKSSLEFFAQALGGIFTGLYSTLETFMTAIATAMRGNYAHGRLVERIRDGMAWLKANGLSILASTAMAVTQYYYGNETTWAATAVLLIQHWFPNLVSSVISTIAGYRTQAKTVLSPIKLLVSAALLYVGKGFFTEYDPSMSDLKTVANNIILASRTYTSLGTLIVAIIAGLPSIFGSVLNLLCMTDTPSKNLLALERFQHFVESNSPIERSQGSRLTEYVNLYQAADNALKSSIGGELNNQAWQNYMMSYSTEVTNLKLNGALGGMRRPPYSIWVYGEKGCGKSFLTSRLIVDMSPFFFPAYCDADGVPHNSIAYFRNTSCDHFDAYANNPWMIYDDGLYDRAVPGVNGMVGEYICAVNGTDYVLPMASVNDNDIGKKGMRFSSSIVLCSSNLNPTTRHPVGLDNLNTPEAFLRRRDIVIEMLVDEKFKRGGKVDIEIVKETFHIDTVTASVLMPHARFQIRDTFTADILTFADTEGGSVRLLNYYQLLKLCIHLFARHRQSPIPTYKKSALVDSKPGENGGRIFNLKNLYETHGRNGTRRQGRKERGENSPSSSSGESDFKSAASDVAESNSSEFSQPPVTESDQSDSPPASCASPVPSHEAILSEHEIEYGDGIITDEYEEIKIPATPPVPLEEVVSDSPSRSPPRAFLGEAVKLEAYYHKRPSVKGRLSISPKKPGSKLVMPGEQSRNTVGPDDSLSSLKADANFLIPAAGQIEFQCETANNPPSFSSDETPWYYKPIVKSKEFAAYLSQKLAARPEIPLSYPNILFKGCICIAGIYGVYRGYRALHNWFKTVESDFTAEIQPEDMEFHGGDDPSPNGPSAKRALFKKTRQYSNKNPPQHPQKTHVSALADNMDTFVRHAFSSHPTAMINKNLVKIWLDGQETGFALGLRDKWMIMPAHYVVPETAFSRTYKMGELPQIKPINAFTVIALNNHNAPYSFADLHLKFQYLKINGDLYLSDCVYVALPHGNCFKDILRHVIKRDEPICSAKDLFGSVFVGNSQREISSLRYLSSNRTRGHDRSLHESWSYTSRGRNFECGDCGSPLFGYLGGKQYLLGFHIGGWRTENPPRYRSYPLFFENLQFMNTYESHEAYHTMLEQVIDVDQEPKFYTPPETGIGTIGTTKIRQYLPEKSSFARTPLPVGPELPWGEINKEPAPLSSKDKRIVDRISPLAVNIRKYTPQLAPFSLKRVNRAFRYVLAYMTVENKNIYDSLLDDWQLVNGVPEFEGYKGLDPRTALGLFYFHLIEELGLDEIPKSRRDVLEGEPGNWKLLPKHLNIIKKMMRWVEKGIRIPTLWLGCTKDELISLEKVKNGDTRIFLIAPFYYLILCRYYFIHWVAHMNTIYMKSFPATGVDPFSSEWHVVIDSMNEFSKCFICGDYHKFDHIHPPEFWMQLARIINEWYDKYTTFNTPDLNRARVTLMMEMAFSLYVFADAVLQRGRGGPSGGYLTMAGNNCVNLALIILWVLHHFPSATWEDIFRMIKVWLMGDDNLLAVHESVKHILTAESLANFLATYGIKYTPPDKSSSWTVPHVPVEKIEFLKIETSFSEEVGMYLPKAQLKSINQAFHWMRVTKEPDQFQKNMIDVFFKILFHGRTVYDKYRDAVMKYQPGIHVEDFDTMILIMNESGKFGSDILRLDSRPNHEIADYIPAFESQANTGQRMIDTEDVSTKFGAALAVESTPVKNSAQVFDKSHHLRPPLEISDPPISYTNLADKWTRSLTYAWNTTNPLGNLLTGSVVNIPGEVLNNALQKAGFSNSKYWRGTVKLRFVVASTQWHSGCIAFVYAKGVNKSTFLTDRPGSSLVQASQMDTIYVLANNPEPAEMCIPYMHPYNYIDIDDATDNSIAGSLGVLGAMVFSPLVASNNTALTVNISVWVSIENASFKLSKPINAPMTQKEKQIVERTRALARIADSRTSMAKLTPGFQSQGFSHKRPRLSQSMAISYQVVDAGSIARSEPRLLSFEEVATVLRELEAAGCIVQISKNKRRKMARYHKNMESHGSHVSKITNNITNIDHASDISVTADPGGDQFDTSGGTAEVDATATTMDLPNVGNFMPVVNQACYPVNYSESYTMNNKLTMYPKEITPSRFSHFGIRQDEMSLSYLMSRIGLVREIGWNNTQASGTQLFSGMLAPTMYTNSGRDPPTVDPVPGLPVLIQDYLAGFHPFWSGPLRLHLKICATNFVKGTLQIGFLHGQTASNLSLDDASSQSFVTIDLNEGKRIYDYEIPFNSNTQYKRCTTNHENSIPEARRLEYSLGFMYMHVVNPLVTGEGAASAITILLFLSSPEVQFYGQRSNSVEVVSAPQATFKSGFEQQSAMDTQLSSIGGNPTAVAPEGISRERPINNIEPTRSFRDLMRRYYLIRDQNTSSTFRRIYTDDVFTSVGTQQNVLAMLLACFAFYRGGLHWMLEAHVGSGVTTPGLAEGDPIPFTYAWEPTSFNVPNTIGTQRASQYYGWKPKESVAPAAAVETSFTSPYALARNPQLVDPAATDFPTTRYASIVLSTRNSSSDFRRLDILCGGADDFRAGGYIGPPRVNLYAEAI